MRKIGHCPLYASIPHTFAKLEKVPRNLPSEYGAVLLGKEFLAFRKIIVLSTSGLSSSRTTTAQDSRMYYIHKRFVTRVTYSHIRQRTGGGGGGGSVCKLRGCEREWMKMFPRAPLPPGLLGPEHEGITSVNHLPNDTVSHPEDLSLQQHRRENIKCCPLQFVPEVRVFECR